MYDYEKARRLLAGIMNDFRVLSGDQVGPSGMAWQQIAQEVAWKLKTLGDMMLEARLGLTKDQLFWFPSPDDLEDECYACKVGDLHTVRHPETKVEHRQKPERR